MVSFKLYLFNEGLKEIKGILSKINYLDELNKDIESSSDNIKKSRFSIYLSRLKGLKFEGLNQEHAIGNFYLDYNYPLPEGDNFWIKTSCNLKNGRDNKLLFFQYKYPLLLSFFNNYFIRADKIGRALFNDINFKNKKLINFYNHIKEIIESQSSNSVFLNRLIVKKLEIEDIFLDEANFKGKNDEMSSLLSLIKQRVNEVSVITFKIQFNKESTNKSKLIVTIRINQYGKILIYGNHPDDILHQIFDYLEKALYMIFKIENA